MFEQLANKKIILGITGGIAAYKSAELVRLLRRANAEIKVVMTKNATEFITPLTMRTLANNQVYTEMFAQNVEWSLAHISLARYADIILVVPASANFIARLCHGLADDLLTTVCLAATAPIVIAPAMNKEMWQAPVTQSNIEALRQRGVLVLGPATGEQACGEIGAGRMLEPLAIVQQLAWQLTEKFFAGFKFVITAGPTREKIDPVRYLSNFSSGKMGYALAAAAHAAGAEVVLISGPTNLSSPDGVRRINVTSAHEMYRMVMSEMHNCAIFIAAAAVADYTPLVCSDNKIKKTASAKLTIDLKLNPDILAAVAALPKPPFTVGFAAETENLLENAAKKLVQKNANMIVANWVGENLGFDGDENAVVILQPDEDPIELMQTSKNHLAWQIVSLLRSRCCYSKN